MKSKYVWLILAGLVALFAVVSCKTTPPAETESTPTQEAATPAPAPAPTPAPAPAQNVPTSPTQADLDALNAAAARAAAARTLVSDFNGSTLFPQDWQSADSLYSQADQQKDNSTQSATQDSTARYNKAADALEALASKTLAQSYDTMEKQITDARDAAVNAGAGDLVPDMLLQADNTTADALAKYQAKDYYGARDAANSALSMYGILTDGIAAYNVRMEIANRGFETYDSDNIAAADDTLRSAADDYSAKNLPSAKAKVDKAAQSYKQSLQTCWHSFATEKGANAGAERQNALNLKANVAVKDDFNSAQTVYTNADTAFQANKFEDAANLYQQSQSMFAAVSQAASAKQQAAQDALQRANQKMTESDETARKAELILQGGAQ